MAIRDKFDRAKVRDAYLLKQIDEKRDRADGEQLMVRARNNCCSECY